MAEIFSSIAAAITLAKKLKEASDKTRDADTKLLVADLNLQLADIKMQWSETIEEVTRLKARIRDLESTEGDPCPKCRQRGWHVESSAPDKQFGRLGAVRRTYKCSLCGFTEQKLITSNS
jgi:hypothetical protein